MRYMTIHFCVNACMCATPYAYVFVYLMASFEKMDYLHGKMSQYSSFKVNAFMRYCILMGLVLSVVFKADPNSTHF